MDAQTLFTQEQAMLIIAFIERIKDVVDHLIIHCYAGQSRSLAVGAFAVKMLGGNNGAYFKGHVPNTFIYNMLTQIYFNQSDSL